MNPFAPPLKDGHFHPRNMGDPRGIPININTVDLTQTTIRLVFLLDLVEMTPFYL